MNEDALSVLDTVGTWVGAALAAIALIGIVSSWIVLRELHSERTTALNYLHDHDDPPFISRGWRFGRRTRLFRSIRVPDLTPYDAWAAGTPFAIPKTGEPWVLKEPHEPSCKTGWARLCRLLGAYEVGQDQVKLGTRGELLIDDGETWLPVSRYWILALGLLGRYGDRADRGVHFAFSERMIRPDLGEQLLWIPVASQKREQRLRLEAGQPALIEPPPPDQIWGTTGSFMVDWQPVSGSQSLRKSDRLRFKLHIKDQLGPLPSSDSTRSVTQENLQFMFWLAVGFLPYDCGGHEKIVSLDARTGGETLAIQANSYSLVREAKPQVKYWQTYEYSDRGECWALPQSLYQAGQALGVDFTLVTCLQNTTETYLKNPAGDEIEHIVKCAQQTLPVGARRWVLLMSPDEDDRFARLARRVDLQSLADSLLSITWQPWSYLVRKEGQAMLHHLVQPVPRLIKMASEIDYGSNTEQTAPMSDYSERLTKVLRVLSNKMDPFDFNQQQTADVLALADLAKERFPDGDRHRRVVGILYMTIQPFRKLIHRLLNARTLESPNIVARFDNSSGELTWLFDYKDFRATPGGDTYSESNDDDEHEKDPERQVEVRPVGEESDAYLNSDLAIIHPLSVVIDNDGQDKVRVLKMKFKDAMAYLNNHGGIEQVAAQRDEEQPDTGDGSYENGNDNDNEVDHEKAAEVGAMDGASDSQVDLERQVEVQIMGDEYDSSPLSKKYSVTTLLNKKTPDSPSQRVVVMDYKDAMDLLDKYYDKQSKDANASSSLRATSKNADYFADATTGHVFQIDVPLDGSTVAEVVADLTKDEVVLACLWAATKCALWSSSLDSAPLMRMVHQLGDVVLVS